MAMDGPGILGHDRNYVMIDINLIGKLFSSKELSVIRTWYDQFSQNQDLTDHNKPMLAMFNVLFDKQTQPAKHSSLITISSFTITGLFSKRSLKLLVTWSNVTTYLV